MKIRGQTCFSISERIARNSKVDAVSGCWLWEGAKRGGYGRMVVGSRTDGTRKSIGAHTASYEAAFGPIPAGKETCHTCDVRACVNPSHLFAGARQENIDDRERKGRNRPPYGETHPFAKLTIDAVQKIRASDLGAYALADIFGVNRTTIDSVKNFKSWKHVPAAPYGEGK